MKKCEKILRFIEEADDEGREYKEIANFINRMNGHKETGNAGIWNITLYGSDRSGLLHLFCKKNKKGKWCINREIKPPFLPDTTKYKFEYGTGFVLDEDGELQISDYYKENMLGQKV